MEYVQILLLFQNAHALLLILESGAILHLMSAMKKMIFVRMEERVLTEKDMDLTIHVSVRCSFLAQTVNKMFVIQILAKTMEHVATYLPQNLVQLVSQAVAPAMSVLALSNTLVKTVSTRAPVR